MKKVYTVYIPCPQTLVYTIEAITPEEAIEIAQQVGITENSTIGGMVDAPIAILNKDDKASE